MNYATALEIAENIIEDITPFTDIVRLAGALRREAAEVDNIVLVCVPKKVEPEPTLATDYAGEVVDPEFIAFVNGLGRIEAGKPTGRMLGIVLQQLIRLDIYMPQMSDFYRIYALQTGSQDYCNTVIGPAWEALGWCDTEHGLRKITDCRYAGYRYKWVDTEGDVPPLWASEEAFFEWLDVPFVAPNLR